MNSKYIQIKNNFLCLKEKTISSVSKVIVVSEEGLLIFVTDSGINCNILIVSIPLNDNSFVKQ